jgi:hypothetical protein
MSGMANHAYLRVWCREFPEERILEVFGNFLETVPFSASRPGFTHLVIRAVDFAETPILEQDMRAVPLEPAGILEMARDHIQRDCALEVRADWDLWVYEGEPARWQNLAQPLELSCYGEDFADGFWRENGHMGADLGFEHLFTGHSGLLGFRQTAPAAPASPEEARFLASMEEPANLQMYRDKTRENIRTLFNWVRQIESGVRVERIRAWSEGEENFEARLEEILAAR